MFNPEIFLRPNILQLKPYSSARSEHTAAEGIFLDANELPYGNLNRYPDPLQHALKRKLAHLKGITLEQVFIGNGSDEAIDLLIRICCEPGRDCILVLPPTYGMYEVTAAINNVETVKVPLDDTFQPDWALLYQEIEARSPKLVFICSPNNPTGNCVQGVEDLLNRFDGLVVVDEAYIEFSSQPSFTKSAKSIPKPGGITNTEQGLGTGRGAYWDGLCRTGAGSLSQPGQTAL